MFKTGIKITTLRFLVALTLLFSGLAGNLQPQNTAEQQGTGPESYYTATMGSTLWETLIDNGVNPALWKSVFEYNRANNPAFARISSASRIPRGTVIYIPLEAEEALEEPARADRVRPRLATVADTLMLSGATPFLKVKPGRGQSLAELITQLCIPASLRSNQDRLVLRRNIYGDLRDSYRRMGLSLNYRDPEFYLPLYLAADQLDTLQRRIEYLQNSLEHYVPRDSLQPVSSADIRHVAGRGEDYRSLARLYLESRDGFPASYPYKNSFSDHLGYMAQQLRHYNLNQPVWPGSVYFIPGHLLEGRYFQQNPEVGLVGKTGKYLEYGNGLRVWLEYHVTRKKSYWLRRQRYLLPLERKLADGRKAYPDMLLWHRTGLEPVVEQALRSRGVKNFSLRYIYRTAVCNYYISESGECFLIVDPDKNPRDHAGSSLDFRCFWNGVSDISDISIGVEIESGFLSRLTETQLETARKLQEVLRGRYIIPDDRVLDHRKVASRRGLGPTLLRGRKSDGLSSADRRAIGIQPVLDPDVLRGLVDPNLNDLLERQADSTDFWYRVEIDPDLEETALRAGWQLSGERWIGPDSALPEGRKGLPAAY